MNELRRVWLSESVNGWRTDTIMAERKGQMDKQRSTKHYTENKRSSNTNPTKTRGELRCSWRVGSSCSTIGTCRVTLVTNSESVISHEWGKGQELLMTSGEHLSGHLWQKYSVTVDNDDCKTFEVITST